MRTVTTAPRILYITAGFPFPLSSGYLRHHHLMRALAPGARIHLLSLVGRSFVCEDLDGVAWFVDQISTFPKTARSDRARLTLDLLRPDRPSSAARALAAVVDEQVGAGAVDLVVLSGKETAVAATAVAGRVPLVVDLCDATSQRISQEMAGASFLRGLALRMRRHGMRSVERRLIATADALITASERDRDALRAEGAPAAVLGATVIPNGVDVDYWNRSASELGTAVVFCGNLAYRPNADAARHLVTAVMPAVWRHRPDAHLVIVGTGASAELVQSLQGPHVELTGAVADVRPHLERAAVFAAPLLVASGIQNKLLEALAMELPVVCSTVAAEGLAVDGQAPPLAVADEPEAQAQAIVERLQAASAGGTAPDAAGRAWVAERFDWERSGAALATVISDVARRVELRRGSSC